LSTDVPDGYLPPDNAYTQAMEFTLENDPLVNDSTIYGITAMVGPAYLFERRNALARSFGLLHDAPGRMTGRLLLVGLVYVAISAMPEAAGAVPGILPDALPQVPVQAVTALIVAAVETVGLMVVFAGILITYAERRGDEGSLTPDLVDQL
jgi:hypothetical protein